MKKKAAKAKEKGGGESSLQEEDASKPAEAAGKVKVKKKRKAGVDAQPEVVSEPVNAAEVSGDKAKKRKAGASTVKEEADTSKPADASGKAKKKRKAGADGPPESVSEPLKTAEVSGEKAKTAKKSKAGASAAEADLTVFVDGVPYDWSLEKIRELFSNKCGEVASVRAPTWQDSGRLRGYAHVDFVTRDSRDKALALDGTKVAAKGRYLKIEAAKKPNEGKVNLADIEGKRRLFVKNLPYDATEDDVAKLFIKCGKVVEVRIPHMNGRSKGFAYVEFERAKGLKAAMVLDPAPSLQGRRLHLDADSGAGPKAGFHRRPDAFESKFGLSGKEQAKKKPSLF